MLIWPSALDTLGPHKGLKIQHFLGVVDPVHDLQTTPEELQENTIPDFALPSNSKERFLPALLGAGLPRLLVY